MARSLVVSVLFASYAAATLLDRLHGTSYDPGVNERELERLLKRAQLATGTPTDAPASPPGPDAGSPPVRVEPHAAGRVLV